MKKEKGFTLVELLAVIVILAVLVLLAVPSVIKMLDNTRKNAFEVEAENIIKGAKNAYALNALNGITKTCYDIEELSDYLDKNLEGYTGSVLVDTENNIETIWLGNEDYKINGSNKGNLVITERTDNEEITTSCGEDIPTHTLTIDLDGGTISKKTTLVLKEGRNIGIETPIKENYTFTNWTVTGEGSSIEGSQFINGNSRHNNNSTLYTNRIYINSKC